MSEPLKFAVCGAGFIGKSLIRQLVSKGYSVSILDHNACPDEFKGKAKWHTGNLSDKATLKSTLENIDVAYHLISSTVPGDEAVNSIKELSDNLFSAIEFLDMCRDCQVKRVVFVSSSSVYGLQTSTPIAESASTNPISSHGIQKLTIEKYLLFYQFQYGIDVRIARVSNPYGPGQNLFGRQGFIAMAIGQVLKNAPILLRDQGRPIRDFIYIDDLSRTLALIGVAEQMPSILNVGAGLGYSIKQIVEMLGSILGRDITIINGERRKVDIPISVLDVSLLRDSLGVEPLFSLREGMIKTLHYHNLLAPEVQI